MTATATPTMHRPTRKWQVEGMDCPSCVRTIETALARLPGVDDIRLTYTTGALQLKLEDAGQADAVERRLAQLGYRARAADEPFPGQAAPTEGKRPDRIEAPAEAEPAAWWAGPKTALVLLAGGTALLAWVISLSAPALGSLAFTAAALASTAPFAWKAYRRAVAGSPFTIETLMVVAALGAVTIGAASEAAVVVLLFAIGEFLEGVAADRSRAGIRSLVALLPRTARRVTTDGVEEVAPEQLRIGDVVLVRPGDRVPADGKIIEGTTHVDESPLTGESVPVVRSPGEIVLAGSVNAEGVIKVEVVRGSADTTLARIVRLVAEAQANKSPTERFIDRFSRWYTPAAMVLALLVAIVPPLVTGADWATWIYRALAVLLIACPCALVISTPAAIASGLAAGARRGLLIKGGGALETLARVRHVMFDKTGTLTVGRPAVTDALPSEGRSEGELLALAASVEANSTHPIAHAIRTAAERAGIGLLPACDSRAVPGKGMTALVQGRQVWVGAPRFAGEQAALPPELAQRVESLEAEGKTVVVALVEGSPLGVLALRDEPRPDAAAAIAGLGRLGIGATLLTGDNRRTGEAIGRALGLEVRAELMPEAKLAHIEQLHRSTVVAMVGDGINDAPALAAANVGIAMGGGTDVALETADAALVKDRVTGIVELVALARATLANVHQNITVAIGFKAVFLVTTMTGVTGLWPAILADTGATVLVTLNALRLLRFRPRAD